MHLRKKYYNERKGGYMTVEKHTVRLEGKKRERNTLCNLSKEEKRLDVKDFSFTRLPDFTVLLISFLTFLNVQKM